MSLNKASLTFRNGYFLQQYKDANSQGPFTDIPLHNNMLQQVYRLVTFHLTTSCCNKFTGWWHSIWQQQVYNLVTFHLTTACSNKFTGWWHSTAQQHAETSLQVGDIPSDNNMLQQVYRLVKFHLTTTCSNI